MAGCRCPNKRLHRALFIVLILCLCAVFIAGIYFRGSPIAGMHEMTKKLVSELERARGTMNELKDAARNSTVGNPFKLQQEAELISVMNPNQSGPLYDYVSFPCVNELPLFPKEEQIQKGVCVRTINESHHATSVETKDCVKLSTLRGTTPICIYDPVADRWVSKSLKTTGRWETGLLTPLCQKLAANPQMDFLDLGSNVGAYTLTAAHAGKRVVAVDALIRNMQLLLKSLSLGNLHENVTLIWNAVSNDYKEVTLLREKGNVGGTAIDSVKQTTEAKDLVRTIRLDDLAAMFKGKQLGIKMDVELQELNVLRGGNNFFQQVDVRFIQMEMAWHRKLPSGPLIVEFLARRTFLPYRDINGAVKLDPKQITAWPGDMYFIKTVQ